MYRRWLGYAARDPIGALQFIAGAASSNNIVPIVSTSIGRVGSKLLFASLIEGRLRAIVGRPALDKRHLVAADCWDLNEFRWRPAAIYKSHDTPPVRNVLKNCKVIFLYGRPSDVVISLFKARKHEGEAWILAHLSHMHASGSFDEILNRDILGLGDHLAAWPNFRGVETLCLRYEAMWENIEALEKFAGFPILLPPRQQRTSWDVDPAIIEKARRAYVALDEIADSMPDCQVS